MSLETAIKEVNNKRKSCLKKSIFLMLFFTIIVISLYLTYDFILFILLFPFMIFFIAFIDIFISEYRNFYKNTFIKKIINEMGFNFEKEFVLYDKDIENLTFLHTMTNGYDRISGVYDGVKFQLFEAGTWNDERKARYIVTIFACEFYKNFKSKTICMRKKSKLDFTYYLNLRKIPLDNVEFNKNFNVFSSDKVEARYLLSPSFMERVLNLKHKVSEFIFVENRFYLFIMDGKDRYEGNIFKDEKLENIKEYQDDIMSFLSIIKALNLTLKIYKL